LWRRFLARRGQAERNALVELYQRRLADVVRRFAQHLPRRIDPGDLATAANVGLIAAIESFDPSRGVPFEGYCEVRIRGALLDELRMQDWLPRPWRTRVERHKRASEELRARLGREPADHEISDELHVSLEQYQSEFVAAMPIAPGTLSADDAWSLDVVPDPNLDSPGERLTREELLALIAQRLTPQEYRIVYLRYWEDLPMREIGELEGVSESRISKIHAKLLERLQERFRART
jgi:RNA polymerase sigma factor FliA